jgi:hypothetical protein
MSETGESAKDLWGEKTYQRRAREALPLLVRQAEAGEKIYYSDLAAEMGMQNPRTLNYPLGCVGNALAHLSEQWGQAVPPIQCVVVNKRDGLPGEGIGWFMPRMDEFRTLPRPRQRRLLEEALAGVFAYPRWRKVLQALGLPDPPPFDPSILSAAVHLPRTSGGEGEAHRRLKEHVARHPEILDFAPRTQPEIECPLPSGDAVDVLFRDAAVWHAAEVKPVSSPAADLVRGIFQCVKYRALLEAWQASLGLPPGARVVLVLGGMLPAKLRPLRNRLGVKMVEGVEASP